MKTRFTDEPSTRMLVDLLKQHGIKRIVISPGATNVTFVASVQSDPYFKLYSSVDERSAAYIACGLAAEDGNPVALSCTGATASRNYAPGLTEAFYRGLPVLAITSSQPIGRTGRGFPQMLDRSVIMNDIAKMSINIPQIRNKEDAWAVNLSLNEALLELSCKNPGPVHINLETDFSTQYNSTPPQDAKKIVRLYCEDEFPAIPAGKVAVFIGAHRPFDEPLTAAIDDFCAKYNAVVFCDQTSNYRGRFRVLGNLVSDQDLLDSPLCKMELLIHLGAISGSYMRLFPKKVWRVAPDGKLIDPFKCLKAVFATSELSFFKTYATRATSENNEPSYLISLETEIDALRKKIPELPFSNAWCAQQSARQLPDNCSLHLGILNSLRVWNYFETPASVTCWSNTGGFGIDGGVSSLLGASLVDQHKLYFGVVGDLAFFYDMNVLGNRHISSNIRLMVINNGRGVEFKNYSHSAAILGEDADPFVAAAGHYGHQSHDLLRHYSQDLGFKYLQASSKEEFSEAASTFFDPKPCDQPLLFEIFTDEMLESQALELLRTLTFSSTKLVKERTKKVIKDVAGDRGIAVAKKMLGL